MIKKILIGAGAVVFTAGATFGVLYFLKQAEPAPAQIDTTPRLVLDYSKDYGACNLLETSFIKTTLGEPAKNLQDPEDVGIVSNKAIGEGVEELESDSQRCVYAFEPGGNLENSFNASNGLTIERIVYSNDSGPKTLIEQVKANPEAIAIEGLGDAAFYNATPNASGPNASYSFRLETFTDKTSVRYIIRQPVDTATFTTESAQEALTQLAKSAKKP